MLAPNGSKVGSPFTVVSSSSRCLSVAYSPVDRECKISRFDQRDSRILYDANFDYYENLVGKYLVFQYSSTIAPHPATV